MKLYIFHMRILCLKEEREEKIFSFQFTESHHHFVCSPIDMPFVFFKNYIYFLIVTIICTISVKITGLNK